MRSSLTLCSATGSAYPGRAIVALARAGFVAPDELARVARTSTDELLDARVEREALEGFDDGC
jgi:hypothetical protein